MSIELPLVAKTDVVVVGGTVRGVAAAVAAAGQGRDVLLLAPRTYLGEDFCATLRPCARVADAEDGPLAARLGARAGAVPAPLQIKRGLVQALVDAGVRFLYGCLVTDVLFDADGRPGGVVIADRAGRQVVEASVIVDATERAWTARRAGAQAAAWPDAQVRLVRTVIGGAAPEADGERVREVRALAPVAEDGGREAPVWEVELACPLAAGDYVSRAQAEQTARDRTWRQGQLRASERLRFVPPDPVRCRGAGQVADGWDALEADAFQVQGVEQVFVLGPAAGAVAGEPDAFADIALSERIGGCVGEAAADLVQGRGGAAHALRAQTENAPALPGELREFRQGLRPVDRSCPTVRVPGAPPVWGTYDVVVMGGGTAGASAAIGAGRQGARVLVVECQEGLGGTGTVGLIGKVYHGRRTGFAAEVPFPDERCTIEDKMEWLRRAARKAGVDIWCRAIGFGAVVDGDRVCGVAVATEQGAGTVLASVIVDATGNADIAAAAGAACLYDADEHDIALQGSGLPRRPLRQGYVNSDYLLVDESDVVDVSRALAGASLAMDEDAFDIGPLLHSRERRRVRGDHVLSVLDQMAGRTHPDTVVVSESDYDSHGYPTAPYFALIPHDAESRKANHPAPGGTCETPYRCLLARGLDGILVIGTGLSMERDAAALVRMQLDLHNQGYAAGVAAAMAARERGATRAIDVRALQEHLVDTGALPAEVIGRADSFPLSEDELCRCVADMVRAEEIGRARACRALAAVLAHADACQSLLRTAWQNAEGEARLMTAKVLGVLGVQEVVPELIRALEQAGPWDAKILQGRMAEYAHLPTPLDGLILALGCARDARALPVLGARVETLDADVTLSHHRAVALALERIGDPRAAPGLARLLQKPGMSGHAMTRLVPLPDKDRERRHRLKPLREIVLARALVRCGDADGVGRRILTSYTQDLRGLFARHACAVLQALGSTSLSEQEKP